MTGAALKNKVSRRVYSPPDAVDALDPCDGCPRAQRCVEQHLACEAFAGFVNGRLLRSWRKRSFKPTAELFEKIFRKR